MTKISDFIHSLDLSVDQMHRGNCPVCHGRNTFTVTRGYREVMYNCYKNSCGISGKHHQRMDAETLIALHKIKNAPENASKQYLCPFVAPPYLVPYSEVEHPIDTTFLQRYNIDQKDVMYDVRQDRLVFPVYAETVGLVDAVGRALKWNRKPKWLRYASSPAPYTFGWGNTAVIVEDAISAYVVGKLFDSATGVALLGTQLTAFHKQYIQKWFDNIIVALDPDARDKTLKIARELDAKALNLKDDLKYRVTEDLDNLKEMLDE